jgi:hypothetical protein
VNLEHLLQDFLSSTATSAKSLETLLFEHAEPLIRRIVWRRLSGAISPQDREDTAGDAVVELIGRLESWKQGESRPIDDFLAYTSVIARHSCDHFLRSLHPQKYRLRNRILYLLDNSSVYDEWDQEQGRSVCGWAKQIGQAPKKLDPGWYHAVPIRPGVTEAEIVAEIFAQFSPLLVDDLLEATARLSGLGDETPVEWGDVEAVVPSHQPDYEEQLDFRRVLEQLWAEIRELPRAQRVALLLNLRDEQGSSPLPSFPALGVASMRQIAEALEFKPEELAGMWSKLPIGDLEIARGLDLERQQVINLRKAARQRLGRRMGGNMPQISASPKETTRSDRSGKNKGESASVKEKSSRG